MFSYFCSWLKKEGSWTNLVNSIGKRKGNSKKIDPNLKIVNSTKISVAQKLWPTKWDFFRRLTQSVPNGSMMAPFPKEDIITGNTSHETNTYSFACMREKILIPQKWNFFWDNTHHLDTSTLQSYRKTFVSSFFESRGDHETRDLSKTCESNYWQNCQRIITEFSYALETTRRIVKKYFIHTELSKWVISYLKLFSFYCVIALRYSY